jgi:hypothetical protein
MECAYVAYAINPNLRNTTIRTIAELMGVTPGVNCVDRVCISRNDLPTIAKELRKASWAG